MAHKQKFDYFDAFVKIGDYAMEYANELVAFLEESYELCQKGGELDPEAAIDKYHELHKIEEQSDDTNHEIAENLVTEFVTPIEREDILILSEELDSVVDNIDEVLQRMYMYNVTTVTDDVMEMVHIVAEATSAVQKACTKFTHFKKSESLRDYVVKINDFEDEGDRVYIQAMHSVYVSAFESQNKSESIKAFGMGGVLASLEKCCDSCEAVGDSIVTVIMKNA